MTLKWISALLTPVFLLQMTIVSSDVACTSHKVPSPRAASSRTTVDHAAMHLHHHEATDASDRGQMPVSPQNCRGMASCSVSIATLGIAERPALSIEHESVTTREIDFLSSPADSPEPPPPKS